MIPDHGLEDDPSRIRLEWMLTDALAAAAACWAA